MADASGARASRGRTRVQAQAAAEDAGRIHVSERQVRVGHRRPVAAAGVAGGPRSGAGALGPDRERAVIEPGDGAAAGADGLHRDHRLAQRPPAQRAVARDLRLAVQDQADIGGGAAHVEADGALQPERAGHAAGGGDAGGGTGRGEAERQAAQRLRRCHAAGGMEQVQPGRLRLRPLQVVEIGRRQRHDAGAQRRRRHALILPRFRVDPVRERDEGKARAQPLAQRLLVGGVGVGVQQRHGDRLGAALLDARNRVLHRVRVQRDENAAVMVEPLGHLEAPRGRHLGRELGRQVEPVKMTPVLTPDREGVREPPGRDQRDLGVVVLDDGIGDDRGAVDQIVHLRPGEIHGTERRHQPGDAVVAAGGNLRDSHAATRAVHGDHVGKRAADIDTDLPSHRHERASGCRVVRPPAVRPSRRPRRVRQPRCFR